MGKFIDLTGKVFEDWTVIERAPNHGKKIYWRCRCVCGNEKEVDGYSLKSGTSKSCGCRQLNSGSKIKENSKEYLLKNGTKISAVEIGNANIQIGQTQENGYLTICDRAPNTKSKKARVICKCNKCGNYTVINYQDFQNKKVVSCGCYQVERAKLKAYENLGLPKDWTASEYNTNPYYEFLEFTGQISSNHQRLYKVRCRKCGKIYIEPPTDLISYNRSHGNNPCLCWRTESRGALKVRTLLEAHNIKYELEKTFDSCLSPNGKKLRFDFYLPDYNLLIEYDGEHHFKNCFGEGDKKLLLQQAYDKIKDIWCEENNISLVRIPYTEYKNFTIKDLIPVERIDDYDN